MAPGLPNGGTAELPGADDALQLVRAVAIARLPVAGPRPVVNLTVPPREPVHTGASVGSDTSPSIAALLLTYWLLTELPCVARPADTGVLSARPSVEAGGGAASL